jgi:16S rRNA (cytosine967-C5)-methyltransferase
MTSPTRSGPGARALALQVLRENRANHAFVGELLDGYLGRVPLSPPDRRLTTQLVYGVLRRRGTLDALIRPFLTRPIDEVEDWLLDALRIGAFQLALLTHVPPHAALNETVELATIQGRPKAKGFLNAILRRIADLLAAGGEAPTAPAADALPLEAGRYRRLARPVLPDPVQDPVGYLADGLAWPSWLAERWHARYGFDECVRLGFWFAAQAPMWLRVNPLRTTRDEFLAALATAGVPAEAGDHPQSVRLVESAGVRDLPGYSEGWFAVQDLSGMKVGSALTPAPGSRVLDLCAAPGSKTTHLAELMAGRGSIDACDIDADRLRTLTGQCERMRAEIVRTHLLADGGRGEPPPGPFDAVLADVPCSNTGVMGRRPELRWRLSPAELPHLIRLQTRLLHLAADRLRSGGVLVYSTCSVEPEENGGLVRAVLAGRRDLTLESEEEQLPGRPSDGGYWARLRRA